MPIFSIDELMPFELFILIGKSLLPSSIEPTTIPLFATANSSKIASICLEDKAILELLKSISILVSYDDKVALVELIFGALLIINSNFSPRA